MPFGSWARFFLRLSSRFLPRVKGISCSPSSRSVPRCLMASRRAGTASTSTVAGCSPSSPSSTALSLPCPGPVRPSEPYRATCTVATCGIRPSSASPRANIPAAFIGPTVCELDGPMPTLNRSKTLMAIWQYSTIITGKTPLSVKDYGPIAVEQYPVFRVPGHRPGQDLCLDVPAGLGEALRGERVVHPDHVLLDDRALVQLRGHVVGGGADQLDAARVGLVVGLGALEARQEGVVDVDHPALHPLAHLAGQDLHVSGQHDQVRAGVVDHLEQLALGRRLGLRGHRDVAERDPVGSGQLG